MNKNRETLLDRMIHIYNLEHPAVIRFAEMCEILPFCYNWERMLEEIVANNEASPTPNY